MLSFAKLRLKLSKIIALLLLLFICFNESQESINIKAILLQFLGLVFVGIGVLGRVWCSFFISGYKNDKLITYGPYSICRNPLYFFSLIGVIGVSMTTETFTIPLIVIILFSIYYPFVIKSEQAFLLNIYKDQYIAYIKNVPCFFPDFSKYFEPDEYVVKPKRFKRFLTEVIWFIWLVGLIQLINGLKQLGFLPQLFHFKIF